MQHVNALTSVHREGVVRSNVSTYSLFPAKLRKLVGYLKANGEMGIKLSFPEWGTGKWKKGGDRFWNVETFTDADWAGHKAHRKSTSCGVHFINNNFVYASSKTQRVVSRSSAESELHAMVSGCSDAIFLRRCMEFLTNDEVEQWQWVDNSAARQLIERQGVGCVRHLSGKILWMQDLVLAKQVKVGQVPTQWNVSDVGTKPLARQRLLILLNQVGACDPESLEMVGQEEYNNFTERAAGQQSLKRLTKAVLRMAAVWGLEPLVNVGAEAMELDEQVCTQVQASGNDGTTFWLWLAVIALFMLLVGFATVIYVGWKKMARMATEIERCWDRIADEDSYMALQEKRVDALVPRVEALHNQIMQTESTMQDKFEENSREVSMVHDYATGLYYSIVEHGGFLRNGCGLTQEQWVHLTTLERGNLIAPRATGAVEYMRLIRQRFSPEGAADDTYTPRGYRDEEMEVAPRLSPGLRESQDLSDMLDMLKTEHAGCVERGELWDANSVQNLILNFLYDVRTGSTRTMLANYKQRVAETFGEMKENAFRQNRWDSADRYRMIEEIHRVDEM